MKIPRYIVIKLEMVDKDTVKATEITDRCEVYEYEADEDEPQKKCKTCEHRYAGHIDVCDACDPYAKDEPQTVLEMVLNKQTNEDRRKMAESVRKAIKDEPQRDCLTCRYNSDEWDSPKCDSCSKAHSNYEPQTDCAWK